MNLTYHYHRHSNLVVEEAEFKEDYQELVNALETISDIDLVNGFYLKALVLDRHPLMDFHLLLGS